MFPFKLVNIDVKLIYRKTVKNLVSIKKYKICYLLYISQTDQIRHNTVNILTQLKYYKFPIQPESKLTKSNLAFRDCTM